MKALIPLICVILTVAAWCAEPTISLAAIHPESKSILSAHGGEIPDELKKDYRLLFERNTGTTDTESPLENGLLVAKANLANQSDFIGYETLSTDWGNLGGILHLRIAARDKFIHFLATKPTNSLALVIDDAWVFYETGIEDVTPQQGYIAIPLLDGSDERRFQLLTSGKRGAELEALVDKEFEEFREALSEIPMSTPLPADNEAETNKAQQGSADQSATAPESKSEKKENPGPGLEAHPK